MKPALGRGESTVNVAAVRGWWERPPAPLVVIAAVKLAIHLATNGVYGFHTDELYYIISGQHPVAGIWIPGG